MLDTSKDVLFIVIAFSVLWLTFFISWLLFYVIMIVKSAHDLVKNIKRKLDLFEDVLTTVKERVEHSASHLTLLVESVGKIIEFALDKKANKTSSKKRKKIEEE